MDELIKKAFLTALKTRLKKADLPILFNLFWTEYMIPCGTTHAHTIDMKGSSYKKLSAFLSAMAEEGFVTVEEISSGVHHIVDMNRYVDVGVWVWMFVCGYLCGYLCGFVCAFSICVCVCI